MPNEAATKNLFDDVHNTWIGPELARRRTAGELPKDFVIRRCLIRLPNGSGPIVEFNEEICWDAIAKIPEGTHPQVGEPVALTQVERFKTVLPPKVDGKRVAFLYLFWTGVSWELVFDATPNTSDYQADDASESEWSLGPIIARSINLAVDELVVHLHDSTRSEVEKIGLWIVPSLLPWPLSEIAALCSQSRGEDALRLLRRHCTASFIEDRVNLWMARSEFSKRRKLFFDALDAHRRQQFTLSIHALVPHIEGITTDWLYQKQTPGIPWRETPKFKKFRDTISAGLKLPFTHERMFASMVDFVLNGPALATFKPWVDPVRSEFPSRHLVTHGQFEEAIYNEDNSIKVFLLIDTLFDQITRLDEAANRTPEAELIQ